MEGIPVSYVCFDSFPGISWFNFILCTHFYLSQEKLDPILIFYFSLIMGKYNSTFSSSGFMGVVLQRENKDEWSPKLAVYQIHNETFLKLSS